MKRKTLSAVMSVFDLAFVVFCPLLAHGLEVGSPGRGLGVRPIPGLPGISLTNPAPLGGIRASGVEALEAVGNLAFPQSRLPWLSPGSQVPSLPATDVPLFTGATAERAAAQGALPSAQRLADSVGPDGAGRPAPAERIQSASDAAFDGSQAKPGGPDVPGGGDGGAGGGNSGGKGDSGDGNLGRLYPRVVMILDTLDGPASEKLVRHIENLADNGVRVIFVTPRPEKGENSADSVLISRLKIRTTKYPVIVVSYNGARIAARNSRAENPKPLVEDLQGFPEKTVESFRKISARVKAQLGIRGEFSEFGIPDGGTPYIYGAELPKSGVEPAAWGAAYNQALKGVGLKYKVEMGRRPDGTAYFFTQSTALKLNTARIFNALYAQYPELRESLNPDQILVLADSTKATNFLKSLPGKGYYIHGVTDGASLESALAAVLGVGALEKVSVLRSQLRAYVDWVEARAKYGSPRSVGGGGTPRGMPASHSRYYRDLGFYRGILIYDLMGRLYHLMRKGQYAEASPEAAVELLSRMWYNPRAMGVRISDEMESQRHTGRWKSLQRGYLEVTKVWLRNYYHRNFKDYPNGVSEKVVGTMINLARDSKNSITLEYAAPYTGRRYMVHLLPARAHLERDDKGNVLVAHVYRTGKEPFETEFDDSIERNQVGRAMLEGYGEKRADGRWYVNDEPDPRVKVVFHYNTRDLSRVETPAEIEADAPQVTALIEKMLADTEFLKHWDEQQEKNGKVTSGAAKAKTKKATKTRKSP